MRHAPIVKAERFRIRHGQLASTTECGNNGAFLVPHPPVLLAVIAADGTDEELGPDLAGWEHVSVSLPDRCPTWEEMCFVKDLFFRDDEWVIQYHPARADYLNDHPFCLHLNDHPFCLHLWRPIRQEVPKPPPQLVTFVPEVPRE